MHSLSHKYTWKWKWQFPTLAQRDFTSEQSKRRTTLNSKPFGYGTSKSLHCFCVNQSINPSSGEAAALYLPWESARWTPTKNIHMYSYNFYYLHEFNVKELKFHIKISAKILLVKQQTYWYSRIYIAINLNLNIFWSVRITIFLRGNIALTIFWE